MKAVLFVYGTLRRGLENHEEYLKNARYMGGALTQEKYALFLDDFPYLTKAAAVSRVAGELYLVDQETQARIDLLEGHPHQYRRELITVVTEQGEPQCAWVYFYPEARGRLVESGDLFNAGQSESLKPCTAEDRS